MLLANVVGFGASWEYPFDAGATANAPFTLLDGSQVSVPMMSNPLANLSYLRGDGFQVIELPYLSGNVSMFVFIPDAGKFSEFEAAFTLNRYQKLLDTIRPQAMSLRLPKFHLESSLDLNPALQTLGVTDAFDPAAADFSGIDGSRKLFISSSLQVATIAVDEAGNGAAAATLPATPSGSESTNPIQLAIDHPFYFVIQDRPTSAILFIGRIVQP